MDFHKQYRGMNENITPSDALVQQTIAKMESGRPHRARKPLKIILAVAAALACVSTAVAANQEAVLRVLYQIAPGMAEYLQPVGQVCEDRGVKLEVVSADVEGSTAKVYLSLTDTTGSLFGDAAPDLYDSWHLDYPRWGRAAPLSCGCSTVDYDPSTHMATYFLQIDDLGGDIPAGAFEFSFNKLLIGKVEQEDVLKMAKETTKAQFAQYGMLSVPEDVLDNYAQEMLKKKDTINNLVSRVVEVKLAAALKAQVTLENKNVSMEEFNKMFE